MFERVGWWSITSDIQAESDAELRQHVSWLIEASPAASLQTFFAEPCDTAVDENSALKSEKIAMPVKNEYSKKENFCSKIWIIIYQADKKQIYCHEE